MTSARRREVREHCGGSERLVGVAREVTEVVATALPAQLLVMIGMRHQTWPRDHRLERQRCRRGHNMPQEATPTAGDVVVVHMRPDNHQGKQHRRRRAHDVEERDGTVTCGGG